MDSRFNYPFSLPVPTRANTAPYRLTAADIIHAICSIRCYWILLEGRNLKITRLDLSGIDAITLNVSLIRDGLSYWDQHWSGYIRDGESSVSIPIQDTSFCNYLNPGILKGTVSILHFPSTNFLPQKLENFKQLPQLSDDLLCLLNNPEFFPDATLKCGSDEILVHKGVLSKRSPVFAAMFRNKMQEGSGNIVDIVDIEPNVLQATLRYMYSGKTDQVTNETAGDILFVADKYQLEELKRICIGRMKSSITVDNVCRILVLGELHDESLKAHAKEFAAKCGSFTKVEKTEEWKLLQAERPGLAMEVLFFVVKYLEEFHKNCKCKH